MKEPKLRFPEFTGEWKLRKLNEITDVRDGTHDSPKYVREGHPFVTSKNVSNGFINYNDVQYITDEDYEKINKRSKVDVHDILMGMIGTIGNLALIQKEPDFAIKNVALIKHTGGINYKYLYQALQAGYVTNQLTIGMDGGTQKFISLKKIRELDIPFPNELEQQKIGIFFSNLDNLIQSAEKELEGYRELKQGMLQKMFPKKGEKVPEIRFPEFTGDWEQRKLEELCERVTRKNKNHESELPLTISSQYGLIDQRDFFNKIVAAKDMSNYYLLKKGEFAYNKSYSKGFDYGSIKRLNAYDKGCLSTLYICFKIKSDTIDSDYLECFFDTLNWYYDILMICAEGARNHGLLNIDTKSFFENVSIYLPTSLDEQKKIGDYFSNLDNLITSQQQELEGYKELKKGLLQQMFC